MAVPDKNKCYMEWMDNNDKILWENGVPQLCDVMNNLHQAFNYSDKPLEILFVDVKYNTEVEI